MTPAELLDQAMTHLSLALEDVECAATSLPNGNKAQHSIPLLVEALRGLRLLAEATRPPVPGKPCGVCGCAELPPLFLVDPIALTVTPVPPGGPSPFVIGKRAGEQCMRQIVDPGAVFTHCGEQLLDLAIGLYCPRCGMVPK